MNKKKKKYANAGRPRIYCSLGQKKMHSLECYDLEWQQIKIFFEKLKRQRPQYYIDIDQES